jgi:hypothetical protein
VTPIRSRKDTWPFSVSILPNCGSTATANVVSFVSAAPAFSGNPVIGARRLTLVPGGGIVSFPSLTKLASRFRTVNGHSGAVDSAPRRRRKQNGRRQRCVRQFLAFELVDPERSVIGGETADRCPRSSTRVVAAQDLLTNEGDLRVAGPSEPTQSAGNQCFQRQKSAENGGFEPPRAFTQHAFQACAIGH